MDDFDEAAADAAIREQYGDDCDDLDESGMSEAYAGIAATPSYHPPIVVLSAKTASTTPGSSSGINMTPSSTDGVVCGGRMPMSPVATPLFHTDLPELPPGAVLADGGGHAPKDSSTGSALSGSGASGAMSPGQAAKQQLDAAGERMYADLFRLGALPSKPLTAKQWHAAATEYELSKCKAGIERRLAVSLAKGADPATCGPAKLNLEMKNKKMEISRKREMIVAHEMALGANVWGKLSSLSSALSPSHTAQVRQAAWSELIPKTTREEDAVAQAADQRFAARVLKRRAAIDSAADNSHSAARAASSAIRAARAAQQAEDEALAAAAAVESEGKEAEQAAVTAPSSLLMIKAEAERVRKMRDRMDQAVNRASNLLDAAKRDLRMEVRAHMARILRLQPPTARVNRAGTHSKHVPAGEPPGVAASTTPLSKRRGGFATTPAAAAATTPGAAASGADEGRQVELAPTPWADRVQKSSEDEAGGPASAGPALLSRASSTAAAAPGRTEADKTPVILDHSLGAAVVQFAELFGKFHPGTTPDLQHILRWPEASGLERSESAALRHSSTSTASGPGIEATASHGSRSGWAAWFGQGGSTAALGPATDTGSPRFLPRFPPVLYAPEATPWPPESFADGEPLFENPPPPETLGFALAVQDLRTMAILLARALEERFVDIVPAVAPPLASLPEHARPTGDEEIAAYENERSYAAREANEWHGFMFEAALDAVSVHCYEKMLALCMDRWDSRDTDLMGHLWHCVDADPALFDVSRRCRFDGEPLPPKGLSQEELAAIVPTLTRAERGANAEDAYRDAVTLLRSMTLQRTARHKCAVVARVMSCLSQAAQVRTKEPLGAEELLPLLAWALARSRQPALLAQLGFVQAVLPERLLSQSDGYTIASLTGAVHALKTVADSYAREDDP